MPWCKGGDGKVHLRLQENPSVVSTLIADPLDNDRIYLNLITHREATKGNALMRAMREAKLNGYVIAAGDDLNDISMLDVADCKIVNGKCPFRDAQAGAHLSPIRTKARNHCGIAGGHRQMSCVR